jgi:RNA polymerase sigma-70 factor (ECF subfamily)
VTPLDERAIYRGLLQGDQATFDRFFNEFFPRLYRFVHARVGGDHDAAQDLCQQALTRGLTRFAQYRGEASLFTWLCQIARTLIDDWWSLQNGDTQRPVHIEDDEFVRAAIESLLAPPQAQPQHLRLDAGLSRLVQVALDQLPGHYGNVLEWKYIDGLSMAEVALRLDQPLPATQSLLARARAAFREVFATLAGPELAQVLATTHGSGPDR